MKLLTESRIVWALIYGLAIIGNAMMFKGTRTGSWIDIGLTAGVIFLILLKPQPLSCNHVQEEA